MHYAVTEAWHKAMVLLVLFPLFHIKVVLDLSEPALGLGTEGFLPGITGSFLSKGLVHRKISQRPNLSGAQAAASKYGQFRSQRHFSPIPTRVRPSLLQKLRQERPQVGQVH